MKKFIQKFAQNEDGATAVEYGLIVALIAAVLVPTLTLTGNNLNAKFTAIATALR